MMKAWIFYIVLGWQSGPLLPEEQKTIVLQFDSATDCRSIVSQVEFTMKQSSAPFKVKHIACYKCLEIYEAKMCAPLPKPNAVAPKAP